jgi:hypothetical protein
MGGDRAGLVASGRTHQYVLLGVSVLFLLGRRRLTIFGACFACPQKMFHDLLHFQQLACTAYLAPGSEDYASLDGNGNVFCGFDTFAATGKLRTAKDGEWADFTGTTTITVRFCSPRDVLYVAASERWL